jgi:hypothetical protein
MTQVGFKVLRCQSKALETIVVALSNINSVNDNLQDHAFDKTLKKSIDLKGMIHPLLVCTDKDFKQTDIRRFERRPVPEEITEEYRCLIGNNRYKLAVEMGYTHIECHVVKTFDEVKRAHHKTQIEPRKM